MAAVMAVACLPAAARTAPAARARAAQPAAARPARAGIARPRLLALAATPLRARASVRVRPVAAVAQRAPSAAPPAAPKAALLRVAAVATLGLALLAATPAVASAAALASPDAGLLRYMLSFVLHLDKHLSSIVSQYGARTYALLFAIVFAETGLVVTPFLPGDSLLFAAGTLAAMGALSLPYLVALLFVAAVLGDTVNYAAGNWLGAKAFKDHSNIFKKEYLDKTEAFFQKYGAKTIVLARFIPIVRTFAPFVAGVGSMAYSTFVFYNVAGAALWTVSFSSAGYFFGGLPFVQKNFSLVVLAIIVISVLPVVHEVLEARRHS